MENQQQDLIQKLRDANNVLVTVSANPSVDQLAACIGLTLLLNKLKKHATAVFSGQVPSTLQFLKPEETLEKNTDSLRDFIVSLDKAKADKLRYKVEDNVVKIFITPYKTSITEADLDFSQGDFNIDVVVCLGVEKQSDLDQAITAHGRILHDATVTSIGVVPVNGIGTVNWIEPQASSLSELTAQIADAVGREQMDGQIATAFLTGIVAETARFSNEKTTPVTMQLSAQLMAAGANQQLVASELEAPVAPTLAVDAPIPSDEKIDDARAAVSAEIEEDNPEETHVTKDGTLEIGHTANEGSGEGGDRPNDSSGDSPDEPQPPSNDGGNNPTQPPDDGGNTDQTTSPDEPQSGDNSEVTRDTPQQPTPGEQEPTSRLILQPPSITGTLTANSTPESVSESYDPSVDPLSLLNRNAPLLDHNSDAANDAGSNEAAAENTPVDAGVPVEQAALPPVEMPETEDDLPTFEALPSEPAPSLPEFKPVEAEKSLAELEVAVDSPHLHQNEPTNAGTAPETEIDLDAARDAVTEAMNSGPTNSLPEPTQAVGAEGYFDVQDLQSSPVEPDTPAAPYASVPQLTIPTPDPTPPTSIVEPASTAPPVPPPLPLDPAQFTAPK